MPVPVVQQLRNRPVRTWASHVQRRRQFQGPADLPGVDVIAFQPPDGRPDHPRFHMTGDTPNGIIVRSAMRFKGGVNWRRLAPADAKRRAPAGRPDLLIRRSGFERRSGTYLASAIDPKRTFAPTLPLSRADRRRLKWLISRFQK